MGDVAAGGAAFFTVAVAGAAARRVMPAITAASKASSENTAVKAVTQIMTRFSCKISSLCFRLRKYAFNGYARNRSLRFQPTFSPRCQCFAESLFNMSRTFQQRWNHAQDAGLQHGSKISAHEIRHIICSSANRDSQNASEQTFLPFSGHRLIDTNRREVDDIVHVQTRQQNVHRQIKSRHQRTGLRRVAKAR